MTVAYVCLRICTLTSTPWTAGKLRPMKCAEKSECGKEDLQNLRDVYAQ